MPARTQTIQLLIIVLLAVIPLSWKICSRGINEWDEARNGVNAYEMCHNHDPINLYYDGKVDTWNAKPPLVIWGIVGAYKLFGYNGLGLRFVSAIATILFFVLLYLFLCRSFSRQLAMLTCAIMLSCKAAISIHLGLTGDFDAPLMCVLLASVWQFWRFIAEDRKSGIYLAAILTGTAWFIKGPAGLLYLPGFFIYFISAKVPLSRDRILHIGAACALLGIIVFSWLLIAGKYGKTGSAPGYGTGNALHTMIVEDTWHRMTSPDFQGGQPRNYFFFFETLDSKVNLWNYLFYFSIALGLVLLAKRRGFLRNLRFEGGGVLLLGISVLIPFFILLTFAANKYSWYLAPVFWIVCMITARGLIYLIRHWPKLVYPVAILAVFGYVRQLVEINRFADDAAIIPPQLMKQADTIIIVGAIPQDILLQLKWSGKTMVHRQKEQLAFEKGPKLIVSDSLTLGIRNAMKTSPFTVRGVLFGTLHTQGGE